MDLFIFDDEPFHCHNFKWLSGDRTAAKRARGSSSLDITGCDHVVFRDDGFNLKLNVECGFYFSPNRDDLVKPAPTKNAVNKGVIGEETL